MQLKLIDELSGKDRLPASGLHLHSFEGHSESLAELLAHHYPVDRTVDLPNLMLAAALQSALSVGHDRAFCLPLGEYFP